MQITLFSKGNGSSHIETIQNVSKTKLEFGQLLKQFEKKCEAQVNIVYREYKWNHFWFFFFKFCLAKIALAFIAENWLINKENFAEGLKLDRPCFLVQLCHPLSISLWIHLVFSFQFIFIIILLFNLKILLRVCYVMSPVHRKGGSAGDASWLCCTQEAVSRSA